MAAGTTVSLHGLQLGCGVRMLGFKIQGLDVRGLVVRSFV